MTDQSLSLFVDEIVWTWCGRCKRMMPADGEHYFLTSASLCSDNSEPLDLSVFQSKGEWPTLDNAQENHDTAD
jgi:hypothetical protein